MMYPDEAPEVRHDVLVRLEVSKPSVMLVG